jgi:signal transduction histidine kinase
MLLAGQDELNVAQRHHVEEILESGLQMMRLIDSMLELPLIEAGQLALRTTAIAPADAVASVVIPLESQAAAKQQQINLILSEDLPDVDADPVRLEQILTNLVANAVKFTQNGGTIEVGAHSGPAGTVEFFVRDNGLGIAKKYHEAIFEPLFRVATRGQHRQGGVGLGLALARQLARLHGGDIRVDSRWRKGSTFWVRLPAVVSAERDVSPASPNRPPITSSQEAES